MTPVWWLLAFIPALVILYFLKLKRRDVPVGSTFLWKKSLEDLHVNSPFQRLRRSLLFFLQLLILLLLITAVWRPRCDVERQGGRNLILLFDTSASMKAKEKTEIRFELARKVALSLAGSMVPGDRMAIYGFNSQTTTVQPLTSDRELLEAKIRLIEPTDLAGNLAQALEVARAVAESLPTSEVHIVGDGCYGDLTGLSVDVKALSFRYHEVGSRLDNVAITEVDARHSFGRDRTTEIFALVQNLAAAARDVIVSLHRAGDDDAVLDARELQLEAGGSGPVVFDVTAQEPGVFRLRLDGEDALGVDDVAFVRVPEPQEASILFVGEPNPFVESALKFIPHARARRISLAQYEGLMDPSKRDQDEALESDARRPILIFDRVAPPGPPPAPAIYIGCAPKQLPEGVEPPKKVESPVVVYWDQGHTINRFLVFTDIFIAESLAFSSSPSFHSLMESDQGHLVGSVVFRPEGAFPVPAILVGFDILETNWPTLYHTFPIFFHNAVRWLGRDAGARKSRWHTGEPLVHELRTTDAGASGRLEFRAPDGSLTDAVPERSGAVVYSTPDRVGVYAALRRGEVEQEFPVSLLAERESRLEPKPLDFGEFTVAPEEGDLEQEPAELWWCFALAALLIMLLEWYVYNRRAYM